VGHEEHHGLRRKSIKIIVELPVEHIYEVTNKKWDVSTPVSQGGKVYGHDIDSVKQILPESPLCYLFFQLP